MAARPSPGHRHSPGRGVAYDKRLQGGRREEAVEHGVGLEGKHQGRRGLPPDLLSQLAGQHHLTDRQVPPLGSDRDASSPRGTQQAQQGGRAEGLLRGRRGNTHLGGGDTGREQGVGVGLGGIQRDVAVQPDRQTGARRQWLQQSGRDRDNAQQTGWHQAVRLLLLIG
jgi:hypothetical protein